jgi:hypothetical protein
MGEVATEDEVPVALWIGKDGTPWDHWVRCISIWSGPIDDHRRTGSVGQVRDGRFVWATQDARARFCLILVVVKGIAAVPLPFLQPPLHASELSTFNCSIIKL